MKAWIFDKQFGLDHLTLVDRPRPKPGAGEVLVRIRAASLNYRDLLLGLGKYNPALPLPFVPVSDGAGEVAELGPNVTRLAVGDRVAGIFKQRWLAGRPSADHQDSTLGWPRNGVLAEYALFDADGAVRVPEHLTFEEAACLPIAGVTAWHALFGHAAVRPGDCVLLQGTGGVAMFALQLARLAGAHVIVTSSSDAKLGRARELGAHDTINYRAIPEWDVRARELTGGRGVDLLVDVAGGSLTRSANAVRAGGQVSVVGVLEGFEATVGLAPLLQGTVRLQGVSVGSREMFEDLNRAIARHRLRPVIDRAFAFEQARDAFAALASAGHVGKLVIRGA